MEFQSVGLLLLLGIAGVVEDAELDAEELSAGDGACFCSFFSEEWHDVLSSRASSDLEDPDSHGMTAHITVRRIEPERSAGEGAAGVWEAWVDYDGLGEASAISPLPSLCLHVNCGATNVSRVFLNLQFNGYWKR